MFWWFIVIENHATTFALNGRGGSELKGETYFFGKFLRDFFIGLLP